MINANKLLILLILLLPMNILGQKHDIILDTVKIVEQFKARLQPAEKFTFAWTYINANKLSISMNTYIPKISERYDFIHIGLRDVNHFGAMTFLYDNESKQTICPVTLNDLNSLFRTSNYTLSNYDKAYLYNELIENKATYKFLEKRKVLFWRVVKIKYLYENDFPLNGDLFVGYYKVKYARLEFSISQVKQLNNILKTSNKYIFYLPRFRQDVGRGGFHYRQLNSRYKKANPYNKEERVSLDVYFFNEEGDLLDVSYLEDVFPILPNKK